MTFTNSLPRYLRSLKGESVPRKVLFFQVQPNVEKMGNHHQLHTFRIGAGIACWLYRGKVTDKETAIFRSRGEWRQWLCGHRLTDRCTWVYAYGLGYCLTLLDWWHGLGKGGEEHVSSVLADPPTVIVTRLGRRILRYVDVQNYWRTPLRQLGAALGKPLSRRPPVEAPDYEIAEYAVRKCQICAELVTTAIATVVDHGLCSWQPTAASLSLAAYRHSFMDEQILVDVHPESIKLAREALFGGRVGAYTLGAVREPVSILDVNSLYPSVMVSYPHPTKVVSYQEEASVHELKEASRGFFCVAEVKLCGGYCLLPRRIQGRVCYDNNPGTKVLCGAELQGAVLGDCIVSVGRMARYDRGCLFRSFVNTLYRQKVEARNGGLLGQELLAKLLLNSLYGKFAQVKRRWIDDPRINAPARYAYWWVKVPGDPRPRRYRSLGGVVQRLETGGETRHSVPSLAASITAAARVEIEGHRQLAGVSDVLYLDTDSLHCLRPARERLSWFGVIHPSQLGSLREIVTGPDAYYWGPKWYRVGSKFCCNRCIPDIESVTEGIVMAESKQTIEHRLSSGILDYVPVRTDPVYLGDDEYGWRPESCYLEDFCDG